MDASKQLDRRGFCALAAVGGAALGASGLAGSVAMADESAAADEAPASETSEAEVPTVLVIDRCVTKPGDGEAFLNDYLAIYAPIAEGLGAELVDTLVAPPLWLTEDSNVLMFVCEVVGVGGSWGIAGARNACPEEYLAWCDEMRDRLADYDRSYFSAPQDMEVLCNV